MEEKIPSLKKTARLAGLLYFILALTGFYGLMYVSLKTIVKEDAIATANNILSHEFLFRTGIVAQLISVTTFLFLALVLYRLFKHVDSTKAKLLVALVAVQVPIVYILETCRFTSLMILKGEILKAIAVEQIPDFAMLLLKIYGYGIVTLEIFFGLWLIPFGQLVLKSNFIPRFFGILLLIAGAGYIIDSLTFMLFPGYRSYTMPVAFTFSGIGELSMILWLLIKGVKIKIIGIET